MDDDNPLIQSSSSVNSDVPHPSTWKPLKGQEPVPFLESRHIPVPNLIDLRREVSRVVSLMTWSLFNSNKCYVFILTQVKGKCINNIIVCRYILANGV